MQLILKDEAKTLGMARYFTGLPCKHGHVVERFVSNSNCLKCAEIRRINDAKVHARRNADYSKAYRLRDPKKVKTNHKKWRDRNPSKMAAWCRAMQLRRGNRTPSWLTKEQRQEMRDFYTVAFMFKIYTGQEYEVDHIVPIAGETVCGLHAPWNLQVIERKENRAKWHTSWPDMW